MTPTSILVPPRSTPIASTVCQGAAPGCGESMRQYYPLMSPDDPQGRPPARPDYKVYRSRPGLLSRLRAPDLGKLRERARGRAPAGERRGPDKAPPRARPPWRRILRWAGIAGLVWIVASFIAFEISSQIQKS